MEILREILIVMAVIAAYVGVRLWVFPKLGIRG